MLLALLSSIVLSAPPTTAAPAVRKATLSFAQAVRHADVIGVGTVERIHEIDGDPTHDSWWRETPRIRIAEVVLTETFKRTSEVETFLFVAQPTWTCDDSSATVGERAFVFLQRNPKLFAHRSEVFRRARHERFGDREVFQLVGSGDGRMPIRDDEVRAGLLFPMEFVRKQKPGAKHVFLADVRLGPFVELLDKTLHEQDRPWISASATARGPGLPWEFRLSYDRKAVLTVHYPGGRKESSMTIPMEALWKLDRQLSGTPCGPLPPQIGRLGQSGLERGVALSDGLGTTIFELDEQILATPEVGSAARCALALWGEVRSLLETPADLIDHRAEDAQLLGRNR